jgi:hypothetical protein
MPSSTDHPKTRGLIIGFYAISLECLSAVNSIYPSFQDKSGQKGVYSIALSREANTDSGWRNMEDPPFRPPEPGYNGYHIRLADSLRQCQAPWRTPYLSGGTKQTAYPECQSFSVSHISNPAIFNSPHSAANHGIVPHPFPPLSLILSPIGLLPLRLPTRAFRCISRLAGPH